MSKLTNFLKLFKWDTATDLKSEFDVDKALNENWDKVDAEMKSINEEQTEQDTKLINLEQKQEEIQNLENIIPQGQSSGENITLIDSADYKFKSFGVRGNSKQETTKGNQLVDFSNYRTYNTTATFENDILTVVGDGSASYQSCGFNITDIFKNNPGKVLYFTFEDIKTENTPGGAIVQINIYYNDGSANSYYGIVNKTFEKTPYTIPEDTSNISSVDLLIYTTNNSTSITANVITITKPILQFGTDELEYEKYTGGIASPSIDYPSEVKSAGDNVNLFDIEDGTNTTSGVIRTIKSGEITLNGTPNDAYYNLAISTYTAQKTGTYTLVPFKSSTNANIRLIYQVNGGSWINNDQYTQITLNKDDILTINLRIDSTNSITNFLLKPKLVLGTSIGEYSPYGLGSISEVVSNKNVFNLEEYPFVEKAAYGSDGKAYSWTGYCGIHEYFPVEENATYTFSNDLNKALYYGLVFYDENKNMLSNIYEDIRTFTTPENCRYIRFAIQSDVLPTWVQIEKGNTATSYIEHQSQPVTIPIQQPFRAIGDIRDTFIKVDGKWYERHWINRYNISGTEYMHTMSTSESLNYFSIPSVLENYNYINDSTLNYACNCFVAIPVANRYKDNTIFINSGGVIVITSNNFTSNDEFKSKLSELYNTGTPVYIDYVLATPKDIECTEEQSKILDEIDTTLKSYKNITNIYSTYEVPANLDVVYFKDIETLISAN